MRGPDLSCLLATGNATRSMPYEQTRAVARIPITLATNNNPHVEA